MIAIQSAAVFRCAGEWLVGVVTRPAQPGTRGVLILVGGPQYRVGSHRQFALLANYLAERGTAVMRFDCRGMGDSTGDLANFEQMEPDVRAAVDAFFGAVPELHDVVIWGLCDAASAATFYARNDPRVTGIALLNPWVRSARTEATVHLKHYYWQRLWSVEPWRKLLRGEFELHTSAQSFLETVRNATRSDMDTGNAASRAIGYSETLGARMAEALARFPGRVLIVLSGNDLTAKEFMDVSAASRQWQRLLASSRVSRYYLPEATHTFSRRAWRDQVAAWTAAWVCSW